MIFKVVFKMKRGPENNVLRELVVFLDKQGKKNDAPVWNRVSELINKPTRKRIEVSLRQVNAHSKDNDVVVVPGKLLSVGEVTRKKLTVVCYAASAGARAKVAKSGGTVVL